MGLGYGDGGELGGAGGGSVLFYFPSLLSQQAYLFKYDIRYHNRSWRYSHE